MKGTNFCILHSSCPLFRCVWNNVKVKIKKHLKRIAADAETQAWINRSYLSFPSLIAHVPMGSFPPQLNAPLALHQGPQRHFSDRIFITSRYTPFPREIYKTGEIKRGLAEMEPPVSTTKARGRRDLHCKRYLHSEGGRCGINCGQRIRQVRGRRKWTEVKFNLERPPFWGCRANLV